jgi:hypothetical protein
MKLSQKINHIKRHRENKRFAKFADSFHFAAAECFLTGNKNIFIVSPRLYSVMNCRKGCVPKNIKCSPLTCDRQIITVSRDISEFYNRNELDYLKDWCGIRTTSSEPLYCHIDKPIAPDISTLNGVRV